MTAPPPAPTPRLVQQHEGARPPARRRWRRSPSQDQRHLGADDVAQHAAEGRGHHAHQHRDPRAGPGAQRGLRPQHGEQPQPHRIGPQQHHEAAFHQVRGEEHRHRERRRQRHHPRHRQPEHRRAQDQVAHRPAAEGAQARDQDEAHRVELLARGGERAGHRAAPRPPPRSARPAGRRNRPRRRGAPFGRRRHRAAAARLGLREPAHSSEAASSAATTGSTSCG